MNDRQRQERLQELWELEFGCHPDPQRLLDEIRQDPELQRLRDEAAAQTTAVRDAVLEDTPELDLPVRVERNWFWTRGRRRRLAIGVAASLLIWLGFLGHFQFRVWQQGQVASNTLAVRVSSPRGSVALADHALTIEVRNGKGEARDATVRIQAYAENGAPLGTAQQLLVSGSTRAVIPADEFRPARLVVSAADIPGAEALSIELVGAEATPLVHVRPDRPLYQPGETARIRVTALDRATLMPGTGPSALRARILGPRDDRIDGPRYVSLDQTSGAGGITWEIPPGLPGGRYRVEIDGDQVPNLAAADLVVRRYQRDRLAKQIVLGRTSYGPGETGHAALHVDRLGAGPAAGAAISASLWLDGQQVWQQPGELDADGRARFAFAVPMDVERGAARFVARIEHDGVVETAMQPFVVPTGELDVLLLPESGTLVAGLPNRIYVAVTDPLDRGVSARGMVVDDQGTEVVAFATEHAGHARCEFTPQPGRRYRLRVDEPLPAESAPVEAFADAVALQSTRDLHPGGEALAVRLQRGAEADRGPLLVAAFCRGALVGQGTLDAGQAAGEVQIPLDDRVTGVLRVTAYDRGMHPVAERLVRRAAHRPLRVDIRPDPAAASPGARQTLEITASHSDGRPAEGVFLGVAVTDLQSWTRLDTRPLGLRDSAELFSDIVMPADRTGLHADIQGSDHNADLLLGTRGWRRLLWDGDEARRATLSELGDEFVAVATRTGPLTTPQVVDSHAVVQRRQSDAYRERRSAENLLGAVSMLLLFLGSLYALCDGAVAVGARRGFGPVRTVSTVLGAVLLGVFLWSVATPNLLSARAPSWGAEDAMVQATAEDPAEGLAFDEEAALDLTWRAVQREGATREEAEEAIGADDGDEQFELRRPARDDPIGRSQRIDDFFHHADGNPALRDEFPETVAFTIANRTDADGKVRLAFDLGEQVTTWQVDVDAHGGGRVGQTRTVFASDLPLQVDAALPAEVTAGDRLVVPVVVASTLDGATDVQLTVQPSGLLTAPAALPTLLRLGAGGHGTALAELEVVATRDGKPATAGLQLRARQGDHVDSARFDLQVVPRGFPHARSQAGTLGTTAQPTTQVQLVIPPGARRPSAVLRVFPNMLAQLTQGLAGMLQEPHGCFEQTSNTSYPNTMVLALLDATGYVDPELEGTARGLLDRGYARLAGFECPSNGYEWFGADPGHQELTAYGLLQFTDLARVHDIVDQDMLARTRAFVLARRDGQGGFSRSPRVLDKYGRAPGVVRNAWCTYALLHAGEPAADLSAELDALETRAGRSNDPYELALIGCALGLAQRPAAATVRARLADLQDNDGSLHGTTTSITASGGNDLVVETTALAMLAWLAESPPAGAPLQHESAAARARQWLVDNRRGSGTFGATQATIQALRALTAWSRRAAPTTDGDGFLVVQDAAGTELLRRPFAVTDASPLQLDLAPLASADGTPRPLTLQLEAVDLGEPVPWVLDTRYHADQPADDPDAPLRLTTRLPPRADQGEVVTLRATIQNLLTDRPLPMVCAVLGLPAALEVRTNLLDDLVDSGNIAAWETRGREVVLYWRGLDAGASIDVALECVARFPGTTTGPASRAWLYYAPDARRWTYPLTTTVTPR